MNVTIEKKALDKLLADNIAEFTIYIKSATGWSVSGSPYVIFGGKDDLDGSYETVEVDNIKINVKTCIQSASNELVVKYGGLFKKVFYITGHLEV